MFDASSKKQQKAIVAGSAYKYASAVPVKRPCLQSPAEYQETLALMFKQKVLKSPLQNGCCTPIKKMPLSKKTLSFPEM